VDKRSPLFNNRLDIEIIGINQQYHRKQKLKSWVIKGNNIFKMTTGSNWRIEVRCPCETISQTKPQEHNTLNRLPPLFFHFFFLIFTIFFVAFCSVSSSVYTTSLCYVLWRPSSLIASTVASMSTCIKTCLLFYILSYIQFTYFSDIWYIWYIFSNLTYRHLYHRGYKSHIILFIKHDWFSTKYSHST